MRKKNLILIVFSALVLSACSLEEVLGDDEAATQRSRPEVTFTPSSVEPPHSELADMVEEVLPAVVNVRVQAVNFDVFGEAEIGRGQGSGVVIDPSGYILTNNHVVAGATEVVVVFNDGERYEGQVLGTAPESDIAVIKIDADEDLPTVDIGNSSSLRLGDDVVAIGFPLGLGGPTVTRGIVSAEDRTIDVQQSGPGLPGELRGLLQTDAAINPGNSGGALVDAAGRLIGINTAAAPAGSAENIGFAVPIDSALPIAQEIIEDPPEERSYLGVNIRDMSPVIASELGLDPDLEGALVVGLFPDGPAEEAGIEQGDVIIRIADQDIANIADVNAALRDLDPGDLVEVVVHRSGDERTIEVELGRRPTTLEG
ncbi:MAG: S1C family serine protease [Actinomycetota bacterium]